jgi:hypothetical protein
MAGGASLGDLVLRFTGDIQNLLKSSEQVERNITQLNAKVGRQLEGIAKNFAAIGAGYLSLQGIQAFGALITDTINAAAALDDLSERTGASVESLSKFSGVARITGQEMGAVESAMAKLSKAIVEGQDATSKEAEAFKAFGVAVRDSQGNLRNAGEVLDELARRQGDLADGAEKSAAMMTLLGKTGDQLIPFLNDYVRLSDDVAVTTAEQAKAAEDFNIQVGLMKEQLTGLLRDAVLPTLDRFNDLMQTARDLRGELSILGTVNPFELLTDYLQKAIEKQVYWAAVVKGIYDNLSLGLDGKQKNVFELGDAAVAELQMRQLARAIDRAEEAAGNTGGTERRTVSFRTLSDASKKAAEELARLAEKWQQAFAADAAGLDSATLRSISELKRLLDAGKISLEQFTKARDKLWDDDRTRAAAQKAINDEQAKTNDLLIAAYMGEVEYGKGLQERAEATKRLIDSLADQNTALEDEIAVMGLVGVEREKELLRLQEQRVLTGNLTADERKQIEALYAKRQALLDTAGAAQRYVEAQDRMAESLRTIDQYGMDLFQSMADGLEGVSNWAKRAGQDLLRYVLGAIYQLVARPFIIQIGASILGSFGGGSIAQAAAGSLLQGGSSLFGGTDLLSGLFGGGTFSSMAAGGISSIFGPSAFTAALAGDAFLPAALGASGAGTVGAATTIGAFASAALPVVAAIAAIASLAGVFNKKPSESRGQFGFSAGQAGFEDNAAARTPFGFAGFLDEGTQYFSGAEGKQFAEAFSGFFEAMADKLTDSQIAAISARLQATKFPEIEGGLSTQEFLQKYGADIFKDVASTIFDELNPAFGKLLRTFGGTVEEVAEFASSLFALDAILDTLPTDVAAQLQALVETSADSVENVLAVANAYATLQDVMNADPMELALEAIANASVTAYGAFTRAGEAMREAMAEFDGTAESANAVADATRNYQTALVGLLAQLEQVQAAITGQGGLIEQTIRMIQMSGLNEQGKYQFLQAETERLREQLQQASDPDQIMEIARQIDQNVREAFNLLDPAQQQAHAAEFIANLRTYGAEVDARIDAVQEEVQQQAVGELADLRSMLTTAIGQFNQGANAIDSAGTKMLTAAGTPIRVIVDVNGAPMGRVNG